MRRITYPWRTQISLSSQLRELVDAQRIISRESLSEYLRKAAVLRLTLEEIDKNELELIAETVVGKVSNRKSGS